MKKDQDNMEILLRYLRGDLSAEEEKALKVRLESDKELAMDFNLLKAMRYAVNHPDQVRGPSETNKLSKRQFREFKKKLQRGDSPYGVTISDSGQSPPEPGIRRVFDTASKDTRRVRIRINGLELILSFYPISSENFRIQGQILGIKDLAPIAVRINSGKTEFEDTCDECYLFAFKRVPALNYDLKILHGDKIIGRADFEL
jgi:hypothetical protein